MTNEQTKKATSIIEVLLLQEQIRTEGTLSRYKLTPYELNEIYYICITLQHDRAACTICEGTKNFFESYTNFHIFEGTIGWGIEILPDVNKDAGEFIYNGMRFVPYRTIKNDIERGEIMRALSSQYSHIIGTAYNKQYNYYNFYMAANNSWADIFFCKDLQAYFIPCDNELFNIPDSIAERK